MRTGTATATEFNREPSKFLRAAERGVTTEITKQGRAAAALIPQPGITTGDEVARAFEGCQPDPETAAAVERSIQALHEAE
jgi:prevent-host-death family protein